MRSNNRAQAEVAILLVIMLALVIFISSFVKKKMSPGADASGKTQLNFNSETKAIIDFGSKYDASINLEE